MLGRDTKDGSLLGEREFPRSGPSPTKSKHGSDGPKQGAQHPIIEMVKIDRKGGVFITGHSMPNSRVLLRSMGRPYFLM